MRCPPKVIYTHWSKLSSKMQLEPLRRGQTFLNGHKISKSAGKKLVKWNIFWPEFFSLVFTYTYRKYIVQFIIHILKIFSISVLHSLRDVLLFISGTIEARPFLVFEMGNAEGGSVKYRRLCSSIMCI